MGTPNAPSRKAAVEWRFPKDRSGGAGGSGFLLISTVGRTHGSTHWSRFLPAGSLFLGPCHDWRIGVESAGPERLGQQVSTEINGMMQIVAVILRGLLPRRGPRRAPRCFAL